MRVLFAPSILAALAAKAREAAAYVRNPIDSYLKAIAIVWLFALPNVGVTQTLDHSLRNLDSVYILIEGLGKDTGDCNVDLNTVRNAVMYPFSSARFRTHIHLNADSVNDLVFYVNINSLYLTNVDICVSHISVKTYENQTVKLESSGTTLNSATVVLWDSGSIISSIRQRHREQLSVAVEDLAKQFVTAWNLDNADDPPSKKAGPYDDLIQSGEGADADSTKAASAPPGDYRESPHSGESAKLPEGFVAGPAPRRKALTFDEFKRTANPEVVIVRYRGPVSLAAFNCDAVTRSSFIDRVCYDKPNSYMLIDIRGTWYHYCEIDADTVSNLMAADSMGRFYNQSIKARFDCRTHRVPHY
jgi:hypothetical protein